MHMHRLLCTYTIHTSQHSACCSSHLHTFASKCASYKTGGWVSKAAADWLGFVQNVLCDVYSSRLAYLCQISISCTAHYMASLALHFFIQVMLSVPPALPCPALCRVPYPDHCIWSYANPMEVLSRASNTAVSANCQQLQH